MSCLLSSGDLGTAMVRQMFLVGDICIVLTFILSCQASVNGHLSRDATSFVSEDAAPVSKPEDNPIRQFLANAPGRRLGRYQGQDLDTLRAQLMQEDWSRFTPPPITEPNCFVEIQQVQRVPGRCTRLGGRIPACQAQDTINIDYATCGDNM